MRRSDTLPNADKLIKGRVYKIKSRNLKFGVWDGESGFIGIRFKFGQEYLFTEIHYDLDNNYGTVYDAIDTGKDVKSGTKISEYDSIMDSKTKKEIYFDQQPFGTGVWKFCDTSLTCNDALPLYSFNEELFDFLKDIESNEQEEKQKR